MEKILIVDDNLTNLKNTALQLTGLFSVILAKSGKQALHICETQCPDLVLLDIDMPEMDGFETMSQMRNIAQMAGVPVIFLTANHNSESELRALENGAVDFITKPYEKSILLHRVNLHLRLQKYQLYLEKTVKELENSLITSFSEIIERRDEETSGHVQRTSKYVEITGELLMKKGYFIRDFDEIGLDMMVRAAPLHDIGKIGISDTILLKPGFLTKAEFDAMKSHAKIGADILKTMYQRTPTLYYLECGRMIALYHHEKYDGSGYPYGIKGDEIPLCARIMALADVYDALVSDRIYRKAMSHDEAFEIIVKGDGTHFDPRIVEVFRENHATYKNMKLDINIKSIY
jgi:putative two-component system response regulator